jgi:hypothetical protein
MVRESLGGFAAWLTAPLPKHRGIRADGQTARSTLHNNPHGLEAEAWSLRRSLRPAPEPAAVAASGATEAGGVPRHLAGSRAADGPASSQASPGAAKSSPKHFFRAPWADWT